MKENQRLKEVAKQKLQERKEKEEEEERISSVASRLSIPLSEAKSLFLAQPQRLSTAENLLNNGFAVEEVFFALFAED